MVEYRRDFQSCLRRAANPDRLRMRGRKPRAEMTMEDIAHMGKKDYEEDIQLDKTDRRILAMLAENARMW